MAGFFFFTYPQQAMEEPGLIQNLIKRQPPPQPVTIISQYNKDPSAKTILYAIVAAPTTYAVARQGMEFSLATSLFFSAVVGFAVYNQWPLAAAQSLSQFTSIWGLPPGRGRTPPSPFQ